MAVHVLICDDHRLFADALGVALRGHGYEVVGQTYDPDQAVAVLAEHRVDVCLIDRHFPHADGRDGIRRLRAASPGTVVIMLSASDEPDAAEQALAAGASAFASKSEGIEHIVGLIERARNGEVVPAPGTIAANGSAVGNRSTHELGRFLTGRELEVLARLVQGQDTARLAREMGITYATARTHIQNLLTKLGVHSKLEAVAVAMAHQLVDAPSR